MKINNVEHKQNSFLCVAIIMLTLVSLPISLYAQGNSGGGSGSSSGDQDRLRDQDRTQDPTLHEGDEPLQDRDRLQDQDRLNATTTTTTDSVQTQLRDQDRTQDPTLHEGDEPLQDRDQTRDRINVDTPESLVKLINSEQSVAEVSVNGLNEDAQALTRNRNRMQVAVTALIASENIVGVYGKQIANLATEISSSTQVAVRAEEQVQNRSRFVRFFFGGDKNSASTIREQAQNIQNNIQRIHQFLNDCACSENVKLTLQEQLRNMESEQVRLRQIADDEVSSWGLFSWRF